MTNHYESFTQIASAINRKRDEEDNIWQKCHQLSASNELVQAIAFKYQEGIDAFNQVSIMASYIKTIFTADNTEEGDDTYDENGLNRRTAIFVNKKSPIVKLHARGNFKNALETSLFRQDLYTQFQDEITSLGIDGINGTEFSYTEFIDHLTGYLNVLQYLIGDSGKAKTGETAKQFSDRLVDLMTDEIRPIFLNCQRGSNKNKKRANYGITKFFRASLATSNNYMNQYLVQHLNKRWKNTLIHGQSFSQSNNTSMIFLNAPDKDGIDKVYESMADAIYTLSIEPKPSIKSRQKNKDENYYFVVGNLENEIHAKGDYSRALFVLYKLLRDTALQRIVILPDSDDNQTDFESRYQDKFPTVFFDNIIQLAALLPYNSTILVPFHPYFIYHIWERQSRYIQSFRIDFTTDRYDMMSNGKDQVKPSVQATIIGPIMQYFLQPSSSTKKKMKLNIQEITGRPLNHIYVTTILWIVSRLVLTLKRLIQLHLQKSI